MLKLLKSVRKAYKAWRSLPAEEQEHYAAEIRRITALVRELGGTQAVAFVQGSTESVDETAIGDAPGVDRLPTKRGRRVVADELQQATASLLHALSLPAAALALDSLPRSARMGGKLLAKRVGRANGKD